MALRNKSASGPKVAGDMTIEDARHLLQCEGGELSAWDVAVRVVSAGAVAGLSARAIVVGDATVWHLALPLLAQYVAVTLAMPVLYLITPHPAMRKDVKGAVRLWAGLLAAAAIALGVQCWLGGNSVARAVDGGGERVSQLNPSPSPSLQGRGSSEPGASALRLIGATAAGDATIAWRWVADAHMQWPVLLAFVGELLAMPGRVRNVFRYGPPFVGVSLGCAMQLVVLMFGVFAIPYFLESGANAAWFLWAMIAIAEVLTLWMHLDVQREVRKRERGNERFR